MSNLFNTIALPINNNLQPPVFEFGIAGRQDYDYFWMYVLACVWAFFNAAGIGANDVANSFATSVGSKTLRMWQAIILAGIMEFLGAYLLGARVTSTIRSNITNVNAFAGHDDLLMFGMMMVDLVAGLWIFVATANEMPVSTTHSVIGCIVGFSLCSPGGAGAVAWSDVGMIVASWFVSPLCSGLVSGSLFWVVRRIILRNENSFNRAFTLFPLLVWLTIFVNVFYILFKGGILKNQGVFGAAAKISTGEAIGICIGVGAFCGLIVFLFVGPAARRWIENQSDEQILRFAHEAGTIQLTDAEIKAMESAIVADAEGSDVSADKTNEKSASPAVYEPEVSRWAFVRFMERIFKDKQDTILAHAHHNDKVAEIHDSAEKFPLRTEIAFSYLQVFTACFAAFAHGANDVANAIGPLSAVAHIYEGGVGSATRSSPVKEWILILGGAGLVFGLAVYGHVIMAAMGVKMTKITPSRGFCIELSAAFIIVTGSFLGLPLSSTHCAVGAIVGVGIVEGRKNAVNWPLMAKTFGGWVFTVIITAASSAMVFSFVTFSPSQIYPLSQHNCMFMYGELYNTTAGMSLPVITTDALGTVSLIVGYPSTGTFAT